MALTADQIAAAKEWTVGKSGQEIADKASFYGLSQADVGSIFGVDANRVAQTGYGTPGGLNSETANAVYGGYQAPAPAATPAGMGTRSATQNPYAYNQQNPYLSTMAQNIGGQITDNLNRNIMPGVRSEAQAAGGYGGSRQGVVEANIYNDANKQFANAVTGMYYGDYNDQLNRQMQQYQTDSNFDISQGQLALGNKTADNTYNLGLGNLQLGRDTLGQNLNIANMQNATNMYGLNKNAETQIYGYNKNAETSQYNANKGYDASIYSADKSYAGQMANAAAAQQAASNNYNLGMTNAQNNFYTNQRQLDQSGYRLGAELATMANQGFIDQGTGTYQTGTTFQNAPMGTMESFNNLLKGYTNSGQTTVSTEDLNKWAQAMGGAQAGAQLGKIV